MEAEQGGNFGLRLLVPPPGQEYLLLPYRQFTQCRQSKVEIMDTCHNSVGAGRFIWPVIEVCRALSAPPALVSAIALLHL